MLVITHHGISKHIDTHGGAQFEHTILDPLPPMTEVFIRRRIKAAEEGCAHAARDAVIVRGGFKGDEVLPCFGHRIALLMVKNCVVRLRVRRPNK